MNKISTFLMFQGQAENAIDLYSSVFKGFEVKHVEKYGAGEGGTENQIKLVKVDFNGQNVVCIDSPVPHDFSFTPSISFFVDCESEEYLDRAFELLSEGGETLMPLDDYGFNQKFGWISDRFGVSWQLNLPS